MTITMPRRAMILAAGLGLRMRPITEALPKPLVEVWGRPLIDRALERLSDAGVEEVVINLHYLPEQLRAHLGNLDVPATVFSEEPELLSTGGGITKALPLLGEEPFFVINSDVIWFDGFVPVLKRLAASWDSERMDSLLLLVTGNLATGYDGFGDFMMTSDGLLTRREERRIAPYVYTGIHMTSAQAFRGAPAGAFNLNLLWDRSIEKGRLHGLRHDGLWYHVGTPAGLELVEQALLDELGAGANGR